MNKDVYGEPTIFKKGNFVARCYTPILTKEEYERRYERVKQAAVRLVLAHEKVRGQSIWDT